MSAGRPDEHPDGDSILRSVFRATPIGITFNAKRILISVNDSMCDLVGYTEQELIGQSARLFYENDEEYERVGHFMYDPLPVEGRTSVETRFRRKDGATIFVVLTAAMLDATRPEAGYVVTVQDVTERRHSAKRLQESENRFRGMIEQAPFSVQVLSPDGEVLGVNAAYERLWGVSLEHMAGYNILRDAQMEDLGLMPVVRRALAGEHVETPVVRYDVQTTLGRGEERIVQGIFYPVRDEAGAVRYVILIHLDLTGRVRAEEERNRLQEQLQQAMKMETVGRLAGGIAHDFNNLLTAIAGNAELARLEPGVGEAVAGHIDEIIKAAESAASLTRQLLAFSRRQVIEPRVLDLNGLVTRLEKMLARLIGEDMRLEMALASNVGAGRIDPGQLEQVLVNLAVNARDAMPGGGRIVISTRSAELGVEDGTRRPDARPGRYAVLSVSDTGVGMTEEVKRRIFEPFFTTKPLGRGTGLGLATILGIVQQAGGMVEFSSTTGRGTTFEIYLPLAQTIGAEGRTEGPAEELPTGSETVLLVEDNASVLSYATTLLRRLGYTVIAAASGEEAVTVAADRPGRIDVLLTDVVMPGMNGRELADRIAVLHPESRVLFASGYAENVIAHGGTLTGSIHFIGKPYTPRSLSRKIRDVLGA
ncbi:MAG TPA: PAS domain S-box protein [Spirochaetia bacterium]